MKKLILLLIVALFCFCSCSSVKSCRGKVYHNAYGMYNINAYKR